jgi:hypothetical protein
VSPTILVSTFVNPNTAAVYLGSCSIVWLLLLCERVRRHIPLHELGLNAPVARIFAAMSRDIVVAFSMLLVCLTALVMTRSRAGVVQRLPNVLSSDKPSSIPLSQVFTTSAGLG